MGTEEFGDYLEKLLRARRRECSVKCLKVALGYQDPSTIYRWLRGEKPPALNSGDYEKIVTHLNLNPIEARELHEAQVRSLAEHPRRRQARQGAPSSAGLIPPLLQSWRASAPPEPRYGPTSPDAKGAPILNEAIRLLEDTPSAEGLSDEERTITLTWQSSDPIEMDSDLQNRWQAALQAVLRRDWRIQYLCRLDGDGQRTVQLVKMMRGLMGMGEYLPRYFTPYGMLTPPYDLLVIPGHGAVTFFSTERATAVDNGIVLREPRDITVLQAHARRLAAQTAPLMKRYLSSNAVEVETLLRDDEAHLDERVALKDGLSVTTQPESWYANERHPLADELGGATYAAMKRARTERIAAFKRTLRQADCYDICSKRAVETLAHTGRYSSPDALNRDTLPPERRLEHLRNVVWLLQTYPHYHLALVDERQTSASDATGIPMDLKWSVMGRRSAFVGVRLPTASGSPLDASVQISEPTVVEGFYDYFQQLWERIPPGNRERERVIAWLEQRIREVELLLRPSLN